MLSFKAFDFNCTATAKVWDMNQDGKGNIDRLFENFTPAINRKIVETAAQESESRVPISQTNRQRLWQYSSDIKCQ